MSFRSLKKYSAYLIVTVVFAVVVGAYTPTQNVQAETATVLNSTQSVILRTLQELYAKLFVLQQQLATLRAQEASNANGCFIPTRTLSYGINGSDVSTLQNILAQDRSLYPSGVVNGIFDLSTQNAVQIFQLRNGISTGGSPLTTGFGVVGPRTGDFFRTHCYRPNSPIGNPNINTNVFLRNVDLQDETWNIKDTSENDISFEIVNDSDNNQEVDYTIEVTSHDSSDDEPSTIHGSIDVDEDDTETITESFHDEDFDQGDYEVEVRIDSDGGDDSETLDFQTNENTTNGDEDDFSVQNVSIGGTWDIASNDTRTIVFDIVNSFSSSQNVEYKILIKNTNGATVFNYSQTRDVDGDDNEQVEVGLSKANFPVGNYTVSIEIDPDDDIDEESESNNTYTATIQVTNGNPLGVYRVYKADANPQLFFTNSNISEANALLNCKTRVTADAKIWCTWNNILMWGIKPAVTQKPNIIFVLTDDLNVAMMSKLPKLKTIMADRGMTFSNSFVSLSLCCPSRAAILTGQYAHNNGVFTNVANNPDGTIGGLNAFTQNGDAQKSVGVWLKNAGYRTALMGKYLNGYHIKAPGITYAIPPGWTEWAVPIDGDPYGQYNYVLNTNGTPEEYYLDNCADGPRKPCKRNLATATLADKEANYMINVLYDKADNFIKRSVATDDPFFLYIAPFTPHGPATPAPKYESLINNTSWLNAHPFPQDASFNEADISDKPSWLKENVGLLQEDTIVTMTNAYHRRVISMYGVEDLIENLIATLTITDQLDNTYIIFTSDNGFHLGEHRLTGGKLTEFDTDLRVPLIVRGPGITPKSTVSTLTGNVDLAPTIAALAGLSIPSTVDGRSFKQTLLGGASVDRKAFLIEHGDPSGKTKTDLNSKPKKQSTDEPRDTSNQNDPIKGGEFTTAYRGIRTPQYTFVRYSKDNEEELYNNIADPLQLNNIINTASPDLIRKLRTWTSDLSTCAGATCRSIEAETRI